MSLQLLCIHRILRVIETSSLWLSKEPDDDVASVCQKNQNKKMWRYIYQLNKSFNSLQFRIVGIDGMLVRKQKILPLIRQPIAKSQILFINCVSIIKYLFKAKTKVLRCFKGNCFTFFHEHLLIYTAAVLLEDITNHYLKGYQIGWERKTTNIKLLEYLITPQLRHLCFPSYSEKYLKLFPNFGSVEVLDFTLSEVGNNCLKIIGINCKQLR